MRTGYLIPAILAGLLALSACGGEPPAPAVPAGPEVAAPTLASLDAPYNEADLKNGEQLFFKCRSCHTIDKGKGALVGPNLHGVFDRGVGAMRDFNYSPALKAFAPGKTWTPDLINQWLIAPQGFLPGTAMFFNGLAKETDRRDIIAFLLIKSRQ